MSALYHTILYMRYLGIDYGSKKVGLALSDEAGTMGFPNGILANTPKLVDELCALIAKENVGAIVIGESRTLAGGDNPIAKDAHALGTLINERMGLPVLYESEVFTSTEARRAPEKEMKSRRPRRREDVDASAAALILTSFLSRPTHE
jgi:putative Holliday junction resolvase